MLTGSRQKLNSLAILPALEIIANKLTLNMTKTEFMLTGSRQKLNSLAILPALEINGTQLNRVNVTKLLGVSIDENLTWSNHINALSKKISSGLGSIKRISHCFHPATLQNIYHGLVKSHFDCCSVGVTVPKLYLINYRNFKIIIITIIIIIIIIIIKIIIMIMIMIMIIIIIMIMITTLFKSLIVLAEHDCSTNWGDCKPNKSNQIIKSNQIKLP